MSETKEPEQIMRELFELLRELEQVKVKVKVERPIPIVRDRQGRLAKDLMLKEWFAKIDEEVNEVKEAALRSYVSLSATPYRLGEDRSIIAEEVCDVIEVLYSMANQMGIDGDMIQQGIHGTNKKLKERGCID